LRILQLGIWNGFPIWEAIFVRKNSAPFAPSLWSYEQSD